MRESSETMAHAPSPASPASPPKSKASRRVRYAVQWFWFVPLAVLWLVPYLVVLAACTVLMPLQRTFGWEPSPPGSGRRFRWRRRMWLDRSRMRRECSDDPAWLEDQLRSRLDGRDPVLRGILRGKGATWRRKDGSVEVDDSYFRQLGVDRALFVASDCGYRLAPGAERDLPGWLVLQPVEAHSGR